MPKPIIETERKVKRVLVMLQYDNADDNEVFDLTALAEDLTKRGTHQHAAVQLDVTASQDYSSDVRPWPIKCRASWSVMADFNSSGKAAYLDDAVNASLPDSLATGGLRKKLARVKNKIEQLEKDIQVQRLFDAAQVRYQHPIARVRETPALTHVAETTQTP